MTKLKAICLKFQSQDFVPRLSIKWVNYSKLVIYVNMGFVPICYYLKWLMFHKNKFLLVDCSESGKYCFCTAFCVSLWHCSWMTGDFSQAGLSPSLGTGGWGAERQGCPWNNPRKNGSPFWSERGAMPDGLQHFFLDHLMLFRGKKKTFIIYICNHKAPPRPSSGQETANCQACTCWSDQHNSERSNGYIEFSVRRG